MPCISQNKHTKCSLLIFARIALTIFAMIPLLMHKNESCFFCILDSEQRNTKQGYIIINESHRPIIANNWYEWSFLAISRVTAFLIYPDLCIVFIGKCRAIMNFLFSSHLSNHFRSNIHHVHESSGKFVLCMTVVHSIFHFVRWTTARNLQLQITSTSGITGLIGICIILIVSSIMMFSCLKGMVQYEVRKALHYMFIPLAIVMCWHVPIFALPWGGFIQPFLSIIISLYLLDYLFVYFCWTE